MSAAPDLVTPVVAYRAWKVVGDRLLSPNIPVRWEGRTLHAVCLPVRRRMMPGHDGWLQAAHASPHPDCECGIYAYHRPGRRNWFGQFDWVEGVITVWGRLEAHADGLRAEHARIEALIRRTEIPTADRIASRLGCDLVERADVTEAAARYGASLPVALIPKTGEGPGPSPEVGRGSDPSPPSRRYGPSQ